MSMPSWYTKNGSELEAELHISTRENCLQSPMLKKDTSGATISSTPLSQHSALSSQHRRGFISLLSCEGLFFFFFFLCTKKNNKIVKLQNNKQQVEIKKKSCPWLQHYQVVDIMVPSHSVIRSHKKKIESYPSMIFPQGMVTTKVLPSAHTISNLQQ